MHCVCSSIIPNTYFPFAGDNFCVTVFMIPFKDSLGLFMLYRAQKVSLANQFF